MIEATYALNEYVASQCAAIDTLVFYPGLDAPDEAGSKFVLYNIEPGRDLELWILNVDYVKYKIIHTDFDKLQKLSHRIIKILNPEDIEGTITEAGVRFQHINAVPSGSGSGYFSDQTKFFYQNISILLKYTEV